jgi:hypothetical protein
METTLHAVPSGRDVVREQVRTVGLALRREALVVAIALGIVSVAVAVAIARGRAATWFDADAWAAVGMTAFFLPFAIWRRERRFGPAFLWTLPVDRRRLALAKVFAGWVWLMIAMALFILWRFVLAFFAGATLLLPPFVGPTALYLFGSALVLGLRHPLRWFLGTVGVYALLVALSEVGGRTGSGELRIVAWSEALRWMVYGPYGISTFLNSGAFSSTVRGATDFWGSLPSLAQWAIPTFFWLAAGLAALWAAVSRHGERRRH